MALSLIRSSAFAHRQPGMVLLSISDLLASRGTAPNYCCALGHGLLVGTDMDAENLPKAREGTRRDRPSGFIYITPTSPACSRPSASTASCKWMACSPTLGCRACKSTTLPRLLVHSRRPARHAHGYTRGRTAGDSSHHDRRRVISRGLSNWRRTGARSCGRSLRGAIKPLDTTMELVIIVVVSTKAKGQLHPTSGTRNLIRRCTLSSVANPGESRAGESARAVASSAVVPATRRVRGDHQLPQR